MKVLFFLSCLVYVNGFYINNDGTTKDKIVGGDYMEIKYAPYQAMIYSKGRPICGASIIAKSWILSAAHCVDLISRNLRGLVVRVGATELVGVGERITVKEIIVHPDYDSENFDNDITLLRLKSKIKYSSTKKPIPLAGPDDIPESGQSMHITGYGKTSVDGSPSYRLKSAYVPVLEQSECEVAYQHDPVTDNMFCADGENADACQGDSGGPGVVNGKVYGVVSTGSSCGSAKYPGVYTRVHKYYDWIMDVTNNLN